MRNRLKSILNIPFMTCLAILILNDFYLKPTYHNWLTGKLSDLCGLFVFPFFWSAIFPSKRLQIHFLTAIAFVLWKSPESQVFIDFFSQNLYLIERTIDLSDLIALFVLPIAYSFNPKKLVNLAPIPLAILTLISFCATTLPHYTQKFEPPQYILFKSGIVENGKDDYWNKFSFHNLDSLIIFQIDVIETEKRPLIEDDFQKVKILKDLDLRLLREVDNEYFQKKSIYDYRPLRDSLMINGQTSIKLKVGDYLDFLHFKGTRLDGTFERRSINNQQLIHGIFKNGMEDSVWTFFNEQNEIFKREYYDKGELIKTLRYENSKQVESIKHSTRGEKITAKYFHIVILLLFIGALTFLLVSIYKNSNQNHILQIPHLARIAGIVGLPILVLFLSMLLSTLIPNSFSNSFFGIFLETSITYATTAFLFFIVFYLIKLRSNNDLIYYVFLFTLIIVLIEEWYFVNMLTE